MGAPGRSDQAVQSARWKNKRGRGDGRSRGRSAIQTRISPSGSTHAIRSRWTLAVVVEVAASLSCSVGVSVPRPRNESTCHGPRPGTCEQEGKVIDADWLELPASLCPSFSKLGRFARESPIQHHHIKHRVLLLFPSHHSQTQTKIPTNFLRIRQNQANHSQTLPNKNFLPSRIKTKKWQPKTPPPAPAIPPHKQTSPPTTASAPNSASPPRNPSAPSPNAPSTPPP